MLGFGVGAAEVGLDEEAHEETGQRSEIDQVEVDGERLAGGVNAGHVLVLGAVDDPVNGVSVVVRVEDALCEVLVVSSDRSRGVRLLCRDDGGTRYGDVLCEPLVTSCAVDKLPQESKRWASRGRKDRRSGLSN